MSSDHDSTCVRVCVRVRPLLPYELTINASKVLSFPNENQLLISHQSNPRPFTFDYVFDDYATQHAVYEGCVSPLVDSYVKGYNATILAYGQTGSGKTHTMGTAATDESRDDDGVGIIPRVIKDIFKTIRERERTHLHTVKVSFLEIYNEEIKDLLNNKSNQSPAPYIREGPNNSIIVANTLEEEVNSYQEMMTLLVRGSHSRVTGSTQMNATSSRSHAIFSIILSQQRVSDENQVPNPDDDTLTDEVLVSKFHFVDLAGSERLKRTGAVGERMKEGININQGLLALGNCISALGGEKKAAHVPFRDSKITRMLQDSLGGNSKTLMIACISPADVNADETLNTLKYANRAKNIKNKPIINRDPNSAKIDALKQRIVQLERAVTAYQTGDKEQGDALMNGLMMNSNTASGAGQNGVTSNGHMAATAGSGGVIKNGVVVDPNSVSISIDELALLRDQSVTYEVALKMLEGKVKTLREDMSQLADKLVEAETQRDTYRLKLEQNHPIQDTTTTTTTGAADLSLSVSSAADDAATIGVLAENRRMILKLTRKIKRQKQQLLTATRLLEGYQTGDAAGTTATSIGNAAIVGSAGKRKRKRKSARQSRMLNSHGERVNLHGLEKPAEEQKEIKETVVADTDEEDGEEEEVSFPVIHHTPTESTHPDGQSQAQSHPTSPVQTKLSSDTDHPHVDDDADAHSHSSSAATDDDNNAGGDSDDDDSDDASHTLSLLADLKEQEHQANIRQWTADEIKINSDLTTKTKALKDFHVQSAQVLLLKKQYENKIFDMEQQMEKIQQERDRVLQELQSSQSSNNSEYDVKVTEISKRYQQQLSQIQEQLKQTKEKLKDNERLKKQLNIDEVKIRKLEQEIIVAKRAKVQLAKKIEESANQYKAWCEMKDMKLTSMQKEVRKNTLLMKKMEQEFMKQQQVLHRRNEEKAMLQKQIRTQQQQQQQHTQQQQQHQQQQHGRSTPLQTPRRSPAHSSSTPMRPALRAAPGQDSHRTPSRRPPMRRHHRESPLARAKAMAANAAALSDSAAPQHSSSSSTQTDAALKTAIESEISQAVARSLKQKEITELKHKKDLLNDDLNRVQEAMMNNACQTKEQQREYSQLEQQCVVMQNTVMSIESSINQCETELVALLPATSPVKKHRGAAAAGAALHHRVYRVEEETGEEGGDRVAQAAAVPTEPSVFLNGSELDYRMFSRIKISSVDAGKRALVYLIHQAVELSSDRTEMEKEMEKLRREVEQEKRKNEEQHRRLEIQKKQWQRMSKYRLSPLQVHYETLQPMVMTGTGDDVGMMGMMIGMQPLSPTSPTPVLSPSISPTAPAGGTAYSHSHSHTQPIPYTVSASTTGSAIVTSPVLSPTLPSSSPPFGFSSTAQIQSYHTPMTNNYIQDSHSHSNSQDSSLAGAADLLDPSINASHASAKSSKSKPTNVFARLTDQNSYTGMYKSVAEEKKQKASNKKAQQNSQSTTGSSNAVSNAGNVSNAANSANPGNITQRKMEAGKSPALAPTTISTQAQQQSARGPVAQPLPADSPLLSWPPPPINTQPQNPSNQTSASPPAIAASNAASSPPTTAAGQSSVFSRLTNPQLYTGAHRARFGLDVQTKHKVDSTDTATTPTHGHSGSNTFNNSSGNISANLNSSGGWAHGGTHTVSHSSSSSHLSSNKHKSALSPPRPLSRVGPGLDYSASFDSSTAAQSLPAVTGSEEQPHSSGAGGLVAPPTSTSTSTSTVLHRPHTRSMSSSVVSSPTHRKLLDDSKRGAASVSVPAPAAVDMSGSSDDADNSMLHSRDEEDVEAIRRVIRLSIGGIDDQDLRDDPLMAPTFHHKDEDKENIEKPNTSTTTSTSTSYNNNRQKRRRHKQQAEAQQQQQQQPQQPHSSSSNSSHSRSNSDDTDSHALLDDHKNAHAVVTPPITPSA